VNQSKKPKQIITDKPLRATQHTKMGVFVHRHPAPQRKIERKKRKKANRRGGERGGIARSISGSEQVSLHSDAFRSSTASTMNSSSLSGGSVA